RIRLVIADIVLKEAREVLDAKFPRQAGALDQFLRLVEYESVPLPDDEAVSRARSMLRDPGDAPVLASMTASNPDAAVTGDKDLLTPEIREILPVMTCRDYLSSHGR
ncbi:MAG: hypothetical protein NTU88_14240, partial [Armatimonadetes bacterium]|nr:hypothetical protein [Armatimonadota bacterium]